ncbi:MAG: GNAT family N-acetyltransferase, partial [Dehalococcoidales bacterium]|nr:GNAT family N-acetyltransferase [Dehalococcoidales bacterium]
YYISNVAVYPKFRNNKLGTSLLSKIEREAKRCNAGKNTLDVETNNQNAIRLYKRIGYSVIGKPKRAKIGRENFAFSRMCKATD